MCSICNDFCKIQLFLRDDFWGLSLSESVVPIQ
jgi:hypothetical protein